MRNIALQIVGASIWDPLRDHVEPTSVQGEEAGTFTRQLLSLAD